MDRLIPLSQLDEATDEHVLLRMATHGVDNAAVALGILASEELTTGRVEDAECALRDALNRVQLLKRGLETNTQTRQGSLTSESD